MMRFAMAGIPAFSKPCSKIAAAAPGVLAAFSAARRPRICGSILAHCCTNDPPVPEPKFEICCHMPPPGVFGFPPDSCHALPRIPAMAILLNPAADASELTSATTPPVAM